MVVKELKLGKVHHLHGKGAWTSCDEVVYTFLKRLAACLLFILGFF